MLISLALISVSCEKKVSVSGPQEFETGTASYFITTEPDGAAIFVDGRNTGLFTPDTIKWLPVGEHQFILKLNPFLDFSFIDLASDNQLNTKEYSFYSDTKNFGSIKFESEPTECTVFLNDSLMSFKTPYTLGNLIPARYKVKYKYPEHRDDSSSVFVYAGKQSYINLQLPDTSIWVTYNINNSSVPDNTINDILIDNNNIRWVGTSHNGIIKIKNNLEEFITAENSNLPNNIIHRIIQDREDAIWVATYVGLARIVGETISVFNTTNTPLPNNYISDIEFDAKGNIWVGTQDGLGKYDGSNWTIYTTLNSSIPANFITSVLIDKNDDLWIGTNQFNTAKFDGVSKWTIYQSDELLIGDSVADLIIGNDNRLWVGLVVQPKKGKLGGVFVMEQNSLVEVNFNLSNKRVNRFYIDDLNTMWIGTRSGIVSFNTPSDFKVYTANISGLPINDILTIGRDHLGNMWFGTNGSGLVKYKIWKE